ncbi:hypothetical protein IID22_02450 [Patescibacteria group bacterium]|nr:hypothetical protein [Patescibacteria group bacterium]
MKKWYFSIVAVALLLVGLILASPSFSQPASASSFDQAYKDYTLTVEKYRRTHDEYILTRSQYIKFQSLTSQNNAKQATINMLEARDDVVIRYLGSLKARIEEISGIQDATKEGLFFRLDEEINWFTDHRNKLGSAGSLEDLVADSNQARERFEEDDPLIYESLSNISAGKVNKFRNRLNDIFSRIRDKVNTIKEEDRSEYQFSTRKIEIIDRWVFEIESRITRSEEKQQEADELISELGSGKGGSTRYNKILERLGESQQFLKEASLFIREIVREIKTAE